MKDRNFTCLIFLHDQSAPSLHALPHARLQEHNVGQVHPVHPVHPNQDARFARFARAVLTVPRVLTLGLARKAPGAPGAQPPIWPTSLRSAQAKHGHANICQVNEKLTRAFSSHIFNCLHISYVFSMKILYMCRQDSLAMRSPPFLQASVDLHHKGTPQRTSEEPGSECFRECELVNSTLKPTRDIGYRMI